MGTLTDAADDHWLAWREILSTCGYDLTRENFNAFFDRRNDAILRGYLGENLPDSEVDRLGLEKEKCLSRHRAPAGSQAFARRTPMVVPAEG